MYKNAYVRAGRNGGWRAVIVHEDGSRTTKALKASSRRDARKSLDEMLANGGPAKRGHPVGVLAKSLVDDLDAVGSVEKSTIKDYRQSQRRIERAFQGIDVEDLDRGHVVGAANDAHRLRLIGKPRFKPTRPIFSPDEVHVMKLSFPFAHDEDDRLGASPSLASTTLLSCHLQHPLYERDGTVCPVEVSVQYVVVLAR